MLFSTYFSSIYTNSHSYGYDCQQYSNLVLLEENIIAFASGNLIHVFNVDTKELWFRRSAGGGGIGHMTVRMFLHNIVFQFNKFIQHSGHKALKFLLQTVLQ